MLLHASCVNPLGVWNARHPARTAPKMFGSLSSKKFTCRPGKRYEPSILLKPPGGMRGADCEGEPHNGLRERALGV